MHNYRFKYIISLLSILFFQNATCQIYGIFREAHANESTCPIKSIEVYKSKLSSKKARKVNPYFNKKKMYLSSTEVYNSDDQIHSDQMFKENGDVSGSSIYEYDSDNRLIGIWRKINNDSIYIKRHYLNYQIILHRIIDGKVKSISIQSINQSGKIEDWVFLNLKKDTMIRYQYQYDNSGNEISFIKTGKQKEKNNTIKKHYNSNGQIIKSETFDYNDKLIEEIVYEECQNSIYKDSNFRLKRIKVSHKVFENNEVETFETENIVFLDDCNNTVKIYSNQNCGVKGDWHITYLDIEY